MTSKRSSSVNKTFGIPQREMFKRRRWTIGLSLMLFIMLFVVILVIVLINNRGTYFGDIAYYTSQKITYADFMREQAAEYLNNPLSYMITTLLATVLAIQGYSYLHNRRAVDFYESQPIKRSSHFFGVIINSSLIYFVSFALTLITGLLITAGFGGMSGKVAAAAGQMFLKNAGLFLALFAIAAFAAMLCGNVIITLIITGVLYLYEIVARYVIQCLEEVYFQTYIGNSMFDNGELISPFYHVFHDFGKGAVWHNLLIAVIMFCAAYFCYTRRKNESAGSAVVFPIAQAVIKIAVSVLAGIMAGFIFASLTGKFSGLVLGVISAAIVACIIEIVYNYSFSKLFRHWWEIAVAAALTVFILMTFQVDLFGFDKWLPDPDKVESAVVTVNSNLYDYVDEKGEFCDSNDYFDKHMFIRDTNAVCNLMEICKEGTLNGTNDQGTYDYDKFNGVLQVKYRLKNGKTARRQYHIPLGIDPALLNKVFGSEDFKKGFYPIYETEYFDNECDHYLISYESRNTQNPGNHECNWEELKNTYLKDLEKLNYLYAEEHPLLGYATVMAYKDNDPVRNMRLEVYDGFDDTIELLKKYGVYVASASDILKEAQDVFVYMYYWNDDGGPADPALFEKDGLSYDSEQGMVFKLYTDPDEVKAILDVAVNDDTEGTFTTFMPMNDYLYVSSAFDSNSTALRIRRDKVPKFLEGTFGKYVVVNP